MDIIRNYGLRQLNTFGISANAKFFAEVNSERDLKDLLRDPIFIANEKLILGGGSNILITKDFDGIAVLNKLKGIEILSEDEESVRIRAMSGEVWHDLVSFSVDRGYWGIENLALVPGSVGAAPMQNIGAYGAELKNVLENVEAVRISNGEKMVLKNEDCVFGYRDSVFKNLFKDMFFITAITLRLSKKENRNVDYKVLKNYLEENKIEVRNSKDISDAVSSIRRSKLPDPKVIGNAGSFFKNVFVSKEKLEELQKSYPDIPYFAEGEVIKIPSAWLIEMAGWKGRKVGNVGVHDKQALVLVNHGEGKGEDIQKLAEDIIDSVYSRFGLKLTPEVNLI